MERPNDARATVSFVKATADSLRQDTTPDLTQSKLQQYHVTLSRLDFYTGKPADDGDTFIQPMQAHLMRQIMEKRQPWNNPDSSLKELNFDPALDLAWHGCAILQLVEVWLEVDEDPEGSGLLFETGWKIQT